MRKINCVIFFLSAVIISTGFSQNTSQDIIIGQKLNLKSQILDEDRSLLISVPDRYELTTTRYPVLYLLDGNTHFKHGTSTVDFLAGVGYMPDMIVVAIPNTNRSRDFTPSRIDAIPNSGGAEIFLKFMNEELFSFIDSHYRTEPFRVLMGHSLGGMFAVYTLFKHPDMFQACIAVSPYLMYDNEMVLKEVEQVLENNPILNKFLYITLGNEPDYTSAIGQFSNFLKRKKPEGLIWDYHEMAGDNHASVPLKSLYFGLEKLYEKWRLPQEVADMGFDTVLDYYAELSNRFGYTIELSENLINILGYRMLRQNRNEEAIRIFEYNVTKYPRSANVYDSLGEGCEQNQEWERAQENYDKAVKRGKTISDPNTPVYQQHLDAINQKLSGSN